MSIQINVTIKGATAEVKAMPYSALPKKGHAQSAGKLNGQAYTFTLTKGQGRGDVMKYVAYFVLDGRIYYFYTGAAFLESGAEVKVIDQPKVAAPVLVGPVKPTAPAVKKAPAKKAPAKKKVAA